LPAAPTWAGHTFNGWFLSATGGTALASPYTLTATLTLDAQWTTNATVTVSFNSEGAPTTPGTQSGVIGTPINLPAAPTWAGHTFNGWFLSATGGTALASPYTLTATLTLDAQWKLNTDTVSFNSEGGAPTPTPLSGAYDTTITLPGAPTWAGHTFNGWFLTTSGGSALTSPYTLTATLTLYAQWSLNTTAPPTVTVIYPVSGSVYGTNWSGAIAGSASAKGGKTISSVKVAIENTTTGKWWNGTFFSATSQTFVVATGTTNWRFLLPASDLASGDAYSVTGRATDSGGDVVTSSAVTFSYAIATAVSTTTSLFIWPPVVTYGSERVETFIVTVTGTMGILPSGTVTIKSGSTTLCSTSSLHPFLSGSITATCNLTNHQLPVGRYTITAVYSGNSHYAGSTSGAAGFQVITDRKS
jgi:uncharacterized repeat protein (TIGR02543 family)